MHSSRRRRCMRVPLGGIAPGDRVSRIRMCRIRTEAYRSSPKPSAWSSASTCPRGPSSSSAEHWRACVGWLQSCCARCGPPLAAARLGVPIVIALSPLQVQVSHRAIAFNALVMRPLHSCCLYRADTAAARGRVREVDTSTAHWREVAVDVVSMLIAAGRCALARELIIRVVTVDEVVRCAAQVVSQFVTCG